MKSVKVIVIVIMAVFGLAVSGFTQTIELQAGVAGAGIHDGLFFANGGGADTLLLVTDGGIYEMNNEDSVMVPMVIMAAPGLTQMPIIRPADGDTLDRFLSIRADLTLEGIILDGMSGIITTHNSWDTKFPSNNGSMAGASTTIRDNGCGPFHNRLPIRIGHIGYQYLAIFEFIDIMNGG